MFRCPDQSPRLKPDTCHLFPRPPHWTKVQYTLISFSTRFSTATQGEGVLNFQGKNYPFTISGLSLVDIGISNFTGAGKVYDLSSPRDLAGTYGHLWGNPVDIRDRRRRQRHVDEERPGVTIVILKNEGLAARGESGGEAPRPAMRPDRQARRPRISGHI